MTERDKIITIIEQNKYCDVNTTAYCIGCEYDKELAKLLGVAILDKHGEGDENK